MTKLRQKFHSKIDDLLSDTYKMAGLTEKMLIGSVDALVHNDSKKAKKIIQKDDEVDQLYRKIEKDCLKLLATQQPMAKDLRSIAGVLKIVTDIERIGDYSVDIAKGVGYLARPLTSKSSEKFHYMVKIINEMMADCLKALKTNNTNKLKSIVKKDDLIDKNFGKICYHVVDSLIEHKTEGHGQHEITVLLVGRHLERIADHITNICERVYYIVKGDIVELHED